MNGYSRVQIKIRTERLQEDMRALTATEFSVLSSLSSGAWGILTNSFKSRVEDQLSRQTHDAARGQGV